MKRSGAVLLGPVDEKCRRSEYELQLFLFFIPINPILSPLFFLPVRYLPTVDRLPSESPKSQFKQSLRLIAGTSPPGTAPTAFVPCS